MTAKIDFYILPDTETQARFRFACRLLEKAYQQKHRVYIHTDNTTDANRLDEMLWTYRDDSFIPHNLIGEGPEPAPPIQIGFGAAPANHRGILLNLSNTVPDFYPQFQRILEIIPNDATAQEQGRERYRIYRTNGLNINTHKLQNSEV